MNKEKKYITEDCKNCGLLEICKFAALDGPYYEEDEQYEYNYRKLPDCFILKCKHFLNLKKEVKKE